MVKKTLTRLERPLRVGGGALAGGVRGRRGEGEEEEENGKSR